MAIRPRVSGTIAEIPCSPGQDVAAGDVLFRIEDDSYAAEVASAEASVARAEAALRAAQATVERYESLAGTGIRAQDLETARVSVLQAEADLRAAEAVLQTARLNLEWTELRSPIAGIADIPSFRSGPRDSHQGEALTTVSRIDPIFVDVEESSRRLAEIRAITGSWEQRWGDFLFWTSDDARRALERHEVELYTYRQLAGS